MCGRFALTTSPAELEEVLGLLDLEAFPPRYNIAPTQPILVVTAGPRGEPGSNLPARRALLVRWGLIPSWTKDPAKLPLLINARSETAAEKASFRAAMRHRRVLVPASGFYEWKRTGTKKSQPFWIRPKGGGLVTFAGLMENFMEPGGSEIDTGAILTTQANAQIAHIHDRMPVVIKPEDRDAWLDCVTNEPRDVTPMLRPVEPDFFEAIPVSDKVNKVANGGPEIQEEVAPLEAPADPAPEPPAQMKLF
jgi:putative SOS response-associated peptidase YedK